MQLTGLELRNFRSIGKEGVILKPWVTCNILVGQNNSGKSNVIRALRKIVDLHGEKSSSQLTELDLHHRKQDSKFRYRLEFQIEEDDPESVTDLANVLGSNDIYFDISVTSPSSISYDRWSGMDVRDFEAANKLRSLVGGRRWTTRVNEDEEDEIERVMGDLGERVFTRFKSGIPKIHTVPEFRQIRSGESYSFDGQNLIGLLGEYRTPPIGQDRLREKFDRVERFVQQLLHLPQASIEVTKENDFIINHNGLRLPLSSYGTGTHELVIMLVAVLSNEGDLYCIEEPEIHMHPRLQREFVDFITTETENTYLISTHSHAFINAVDWLDDVQVFHLKSSSGSSAGRPLISDDDALRALNDIGVSPSDLLQTNCTIWVEGPSDRIYIRRWLELLSPELVEGRDYSIMFYGGRLLSHLGFARRKVPEQLIPLLRINQNSIVVIDSDRKKPGGRLNSTKERVQDECEKNGGYCWITDGREIENLMPISPVQRVIKAIRGKDIELELGKYDSFPDNLDEALKSARLRQVPYTKEKVQYARKFAESTRQEDLDDSLISVLDDVTEKIKSWNQ